MLKINVSTSIWKNVKIMVNGAIRTLPVGYLTAVSLYISVMQAFNNSGHAKWDLHGQFQRMEKKRILIWLFSFQKVFSTEKNKSSPKTCMQAFDFSRERSIHMKYDTASNNRDRE